MASASTHPTAPTANGEADARSRREEMILHHLPLARLLARRFARGAESAEDLSQVAMIGLIKAVDRFDERRGNSFAAFATPTIAGELRRHLRDQGQTIRLPRPLWEARSAVMRARARLHAEHGREPSFESVARDTGLARDLVEEVAASETVARPLSLSEPDVDDHPAPASWIGTEDPAFAAAEARADLDDGLRALTRRERLILHLRFARDLTQGDIAARVGIS